MKRTPIDLVILRASASGRCAFAVPKGSGSIGPRREPTGSAPELALELPILEVPQIEVEDAADAEIELPDSCLEVGDLTD